MTVENKNTQSYDLTEVNALVMTSFKQSVVIVSLFANLTLFVTWLVVTIS